MKIVLIVAHLKTAPTSSNVLNVSTNITTTEPPLADCQNGPKCFLVYINDLRTPVTLYDYVDDSTLFELSGRKGVFVFQESVLSSPLSGHCKII